MPSLTQQFNDARQLTALARRLTLQGMGLGPATGDRATRQGGAIIVTDQREGNTGDHYGGTNVSYAQEIFWFDVSGGHGSSTEGQTEDESDRLTPEEQTAAKADNSDEQGEDTEEEEDWEIPMQFGEFFGPDVYYDIQNAIQNPPDIVYENNDLVQDDEDEWVGVGDEILVWDVGDLPLSEFTKYVWAGAGEVKGYPGQFTIRCRYPWATYIYWIDTRTSPDTIYRANERKLRRDFIIPPWNDNENKVWREIDDYPPCFDEGVLNG